MTRHAIKSVTAEYIHHFRHFSWSAILAGAFVATGLGFLLNLFGIAIGLSMIRNTPDGINALAAGGYAGLLIGTVASMFTAGFTAGFLGALSQTKRNLGVLYGFTAWCAGLILAAVLTSYITQYVSAYADLVTGHAAITAMDNGIAAQKSAAHPAAGMFLIFLLFFTGAVSGCFGGHYGAEYKEKYCLE